MTRLCAALVAGLWLSLMPALASAQSMTGAESAELARFPLTQDLLDRMTAVNRDMAAQDIVLLPKMDLSQVSALAQLVDNFTPEAQAVMAKHKLTPHDYLFAKLALADAREGARYDASFQAQSYTNPDNITFYKAHQAEIDKALGL